ncbi:MULTISPECIES: hypothetical protein [unclassified Acinetobacter]|jgi:hypothetical protein|uniref:hypothetical protein n=1 Tax=unclassified Acinetobacter TaxID=196816 RepID=UPI000A35B9E6|nr:MULTISPECIES: hypothetical protein [unclassified Acinetobacter]OTG60879.1 hypothetical protein B9T36_00225 [Acinetobacter sp. ANC 4204]RGD93309.1 hypothetical protein DYI96_00245 [Acinetobacter sp. SWAC57]
MSELSLDFLDETLDKYEAKGKKKAIKKIRIGYMLYAKFMSNPKFADNVINSSLDPKKRTYRNTKIKITHDEYELTFLRNDD